MTQPSAYEQWAAGFLPVVIGSKANDYDGDLKGNYYEYVFAGDPTNQSVTATPPVLEFEGGELWMTYLQRANDTNLLYGLESRTNLVTEGTWDHFDYEVLGTNIIGRDFNAITNCIPISETQLFIRLKTH